MTPSCLFIYFFKKESLSLSLLADIFLFIADIFSQNWVTCVSPLRLVRDKGEFSCLHWHKWIMMRPLGLEAGPIFPERITAFQIPEKEKGMCGRAENARLLPVSQCCSRSFHVTTHMWIACVWRSEFANSLLKCFKTLKLEFTNRNSLLQKLGFFKPCTVQIKTFKKLDFFTSQNSLVIPQPLNSMHIWE